MSVNQDDYIQQLVRGYANGRTLKEISQEISENAKNMEAEWLARKQEKIKAIEDTTRDLQDARAKGDISENSEYANAVTQLQQNKMALATYNDKLLLLGSIKDEVRYKPIGMILLYSTFLVEDSKGAKFIFKIYPKGISDLSKGIMRRDCRFAKAVWGKKVGDLVYVDDQSVDETLEYTIKEIW